MNEIGRPICSELCEGPVLPSFLIFGLPTTPNLARQFTMADAQTKSNHKTSVLEGGGDDRIVPKTQGFWVLYQGCWLRPPAVQSVKIVQEQFKARPDDILLIT